jgi:hypothetical protein
MKDAHNVFHHKYLKETLSSPSSHLVQPITFLTSNTHQELYNTVNTSQFVNLQKVSLHQSRYFNILSRKTSDIIHSVQQISSTQNFSKYQTRSVVRMQLLSQFQSFIISLYFPMSGFSVLSIY